MSDNETIVDIIAEIRDLAAHRDWHNHTGQSNRERLSHLADRLEAAHKRERELLTKPAENVNSAPTSDTDVNSRPCNKHCDDYDCPKNAGGVCHAPNRCLGYEEAGKVLAELGAAKRELAKFRAAGDCAKLREALDESRRIASDLGGCRLNDYWKLNEIVRVCDAALAAPPRNCDRFANVDEARKAHEEYRGDYIMRASNKFDFPMEFEAWLFAPATEKEGGNNG